jgi:hypothetical protein
MSILNGTGASHPGYVPRCGTNPDTHKYPRLAPQAGKYHEAADVCLVDSSASLNR